MEESINPTKKVIAWIEGMGAQFPSRFVFMLRSTINQTTYVESHCNEAHHGKGSIDGVGGTIKN